MIHPQPKPKRVRLKGKAYTEFRKAVYEREQGICQGCRQYAPLLWGGVFNEYRCGHVSHKKSRGAGGGDTMDNVKWLCFDCHRAEHDGKA